MIGDPKIAAELAEVNTDLDLVVDRILRAWLIAQLERRAVPEGSLQRDPMVEMLIGDYLNRTPSHRPRTTLTICSTCDGSRAAQQRSTA
ncbi:hypothetical protein GS528_16575 [Rhodococcus hoagii]|nr:hypothetical protein [Prescottella equi]